MQTNPLNAIIASEIAYGSIPYMETGTNHQRFSDTVNSFGLAGCQDQAWCGTYQFAIELETVGKAQALKNWNMTDKYVGYSCFETYDKFAAAGKVGMTPKPGALVIFKKSHMGRVLSAQGGYFSCGEGNTSNKAFNRDGDACAVKRYKADDPSIKGFCYIDYKGQEMTAKDIINACANVYQMAHNGHYRYGDSHAMPPCSDGIISCDRLIARALYNLGFTAQPGGNGTTAGITVINMDGYLRKWGFKVVTDQWALKAGDIVLMSQNGQSAPTDAWHTFIITDVVGKTSNGLLINKYDCGRQERIDAGQPFVNVPVNQWATRSFHCAYRWESKDEYKLNPGVVKAGSTGKDQLLANRILKARGYKGTKKDGVLQDLELNNVWTVGDVAALVKYKWDRIVNGKNLCKGIKGDEITAKVWSDMIGLPLPVKCVVIPDRCGTGALVLLLQEILRSEGFKGKDGELVGLDQQFGENTRHALIQYQKKYGLEPNGKCTYDVWAHMLNRKW